MQEYADASQEQTAADIATTLLNDINPTYDEYEEILAKRGLYLANTKNKREALTALNNYLKKFPDGDFYHDVALVKDQLFFDVDDMNATTRLVEFNKLMEEYGDDSIGHKALYEKIIPNINIKNYMKKLNCSILWSNTVMYLH